MKGTVSTTGIMNQSSKMPEGNVNPQLPKSKPETQTAEAPVVNTQNTTTVQAPTDEDMETILKQIDQLQIELTVLTADYEQLMHRLEKLLAIEGESEAEEFISNYSSKMGERATQQISISTGCTKSCCITKGFKERQKG